MLINIWSCTLLYFHSQVALYYSELCYVLWSYAALYHMELCSIISFSGNLYWQNTLTNVMVERLHWGNVCTYEVTLICGASISPVVVRFTIRLIAVVNMAENGFCSLHVVWHLQCVCESFFTFGFTGGIYATSWGCNLRVNWWQYVQNMNTTENAIWRRYSQVIHTFCLFLTVGLVIVSIKFQVDIKCVIVNTIQSLI